MPAFHMVHNPEKEKPMPRIPLITGKDNLPAEHHALADSVMKVFGNPHVRGPFSVLLHSPKLTKHLLPLVTHFRDGFFLGKRCYYEK